MEISVQSEFGNIAEEQDNGVASSVDSLRNHCRLSSGKSFPCASLASGLRSNESSAVMVASSEVEIECNCPGRTVKTTEFATCCVPIPGTLNSYLTFTVQLPTKTGSNIAVGPCGVNQESALESATDQMADTVHSLPSASATYASKLPMLPELMRIRFAGSLLSGRASI